jgi:hypothetical protein
MDLMLSLLLLEKGNAELPRRGKHTKETRGDGRKRDATLFRLGVLSPQDKLDARSSSRARNHSSPPIVDDVCLPHIRNIAPSGKRFLSCVHTVHDFARRFSPHFVSFVTIVWHKQPSRAPIPHENCSPDSAGILVQSHLAICECLC